MGQISFLRMAVRTVLAEAHGPSVHHATRTIIILSVSELRAYRLGPQHMSYTS